MCMNFPYNQGVAKQSSDKFVHDFSEGRGRIYPLIHHNQGPCAERESCLALPRRQLGGGYGGRTLDLLTFIVLSRMLTLQLQIPV